MKRSDLESLHDSTLDRVSLEWEDGVVIVELSEVRNDSSRMVIEARNVTRMTCPRLHPWGPSSFVNSVQLLEERLLTIEMQSGDVVELESSDGSFSIIRD